MHRAGPPRGAAARRRDAQPVELVRDRLQARALGAQPPDLVDERRGRSARRPQRHSLRAQARERRSHRAAKLFAARERGKEKDYYELAFVLLYNRAGGPKQAGDQLMTEFALDLRNSAALLVRSKLGSKAQTTLDRNRMPRRRYSCIRRQIQQYCARTL